MGVFLFSFYWHTVCFLKSNPYCAIIIQFTSYTSFNHPSKFVVSDKFV